MQAATIGWDTLAGAWDAAVESRIHPFTLRYDEARGVWIVLDGAGAPLPARAFRRGAGG